MTLLNFNKFDVGKRETTFLQTPSVPCTSMTLEDSILGPHFRINSSLLWMNRAYDYGFSRVFTSDIFRSYYLLYDLSTLPYR